MNIDINERTELVGREIEAHYKEGKKKIIARKCLIHARNWIFNNYAGDINGANSKKLKKECYNDVKDNVIKEYKAEYGSVIGFILMYVILPIILRWIIERLINNTSDKPPYGDI